METNDKLLNKIHRKLHKYRNRNNNRYKYVYKVDNQWVFEIEQVEALLELNSDFIVSVYSIDTGNIERVYPFRKENIK